MTRKWRSLRIILLGAFLALVVTTGMLKFVLAETPPQISISCAESKFLVLNETGQEAWVNPAYLAVVIEEAYLQDGTSVTGQRTFADVIGDNRKTQPGQMNGPIGDLSEYGYVRGHVTGQVSFRNGGPDGGVLKDYYLSAQPIECGEDPTPPPTCSKDQAVWNDVDHRTVVVTYTGSLECLVGFGAYNRNGHGSVNEGDQTLWGPPAWAIVSPSNRIVQLQTSDYSPFCTSQMDVVLDKLDGPKDQLFPNPLTASNQGYQYNHLVTHAEHGGGGLPFGNETCVGTPTPTGTATGTATATSTPTPTGTATPSATPTPSSTPTGTATGTATATSTPTPTGTGTSTATATPTSTSTGTQTPSVTPTPSPSVTPTPTPTNTGQVGTATSTPTVTPTVTGTTQPTATATVTPTATNTPVTQNNACLMVIKHNESDLGIPNWPFSLTKGELVLNGKTNAVGVIEFPELPIGRWTVTEATINGWQPYPPFQSSIQVDVPIMEEGQCMVVLFKNRQVPPVVFYIFFPLIEGEKEDATPAPSPTPMPYCASRELKIEYLGQTITEPFDVLATNVLDLALLRKDQPVTISMVDGLAVAEAHRLWPDDYESLPSKVPPWTVNSTGDPTLKVDLKEEWVLAFAYYDRQVRCVKIVKGIYDPPELAQSATNTEAAPVYIWTDPLTGKNYFLPIRRIVLE